MIGDGWMLLEVSERLVDGGIRLLEFGDGGHEPQAHRVPVGVHEAAADDPVGAIAHEQHGGALSPLHEEPVLDLSLRELEDLLDADGHLGGLRARDPQAPLGEQGVHALAVDNHVRCNRVVARADAHDRAGAVFDELLDEDAADVLRPRALGQLGEPLVEGAAQHGVGVLPDLGERRAREVDGRGRLLSEKADALVGYLALEGDVAPHAVHAAVLVGVEHRAQAVRVEAPPGHVLRAAVLAALGDEHRLPAPGRDVGGDGPGEPPCNRELLGRVHAAPDAHHVAGRLEARRRDGTGVRYLCRG